MGILSYLLLAVGIGFVVYAINRWTPIDPAFKALALWVGIGFLILVLLYALGLLPFWDRPIPRVR